MDSIQKLAQMRVRKSKKSAEELRQEYADNTTSPYEDLRMDDPYIEEKIRAKKKLKPFYDRLKSKQES